MPPRTPCPRCNSKEEVEAYNSGKRRQGVIKLYQTWQHKSQKSATKTPILWCEKCNYTEVQD